MLRHTLGRRLAALLTVAAVAAGCVTAAQAATVKPLKFIDPVSSVTGLHQTSGLSGFPARDYLARGGSLVRAPFSGCVPTNRPWGWLAYQSPNEGFGGARVYLTQTRTGRQGYFAHFGNPAFGGIFLKPGECFRQGDPMGHLWAWPGNPGRSHIHFGWTGGDPLPRVVDRYGNFLIHEGPVWEPGPEGQIFPRPILRHEGDKWRVQVGDKRVYQGGEQKARVLYERQKLARSINLFFRRHWPASPLVGFGLVMVRDGARYDIDPRLPAAIASCETNAGTKGYGPYVNNDFGLLTRSAGHREFPNRAEAIDYLSELLRDQYTRKGLDIIGEIGAKYAPSSATNDPQRKNLSWDDCVIRYYRELHGTRYLHPLPTLEKVPATLSFGRRCPDGTPGRWQVRRGDELLLQCVYQVAESFKTEKTGYWERQNRRAG